MTTLKEVEEWLIENNASIVVNDDRFMVSARGTSAEFKHITTAIGSIMKMSTATPKIEMEEGQQSLFSPGKDLIDKDGQPILF